MDHIWDHDDNKVRDELNLTRKPIELSNHKQRVRGYRSGKCIAQDKPIGMPATFDFAELLNDSILSHYVARPVVKIVPIAGATSALELSLAG